MPRVFAANYWSREDCCQVGGGWKQFGSFFMFLPTNSILESITWDLWGDLWKKSIETATNPSTWTMKSPPAPRACNVHNFWGQWCYRRSGESRWRSGHLGTGFCSRWLLLVVVNVIRRHQLVVSKIGWQFLFQNLQLYSTKRLFPRWLWNHSPEIWGANKKFVTK